MSAVVAWPKDIATLCAVDGVTDDCSALAEIARMTEVLLDVERPNRALLVMRMGPYRPHAEAYVEIRLTSGVIEVQCLTPWCLTRGRETIRKVTGAMPRFDQNYLDWDDPRPQSSHACVHARAAEAYILRKGVRREIIFV